MARNKKRTRQPPVSLSPLTPEDALAGLLQVKPEKGEQMPKFKNEQRVKIIAGDHSGKTGTIFGHPTTLVEAGLPETSVADGQDVATYAITTPVEYLVDLDGLDATVLVMESDLEAI